MNIYFNSWESVSRVLVSTIIAYIMVIIMLRLSGKRSLSKLNLFDFIITIALGSMLASMIVDESTTIVDGFAALSMLLLAQYIITWIALRWSNVANIINPRPTVVYQEGEFLFERMKQVHITEDELLAEIRQKGVACLDDVYAIVIESNGVVSVLLNKEGIKRSTIEKLVV